MDINEFVKNFADQFDDTDPSEITAETAYHDLDEWSSMIGLSVLNMVDKNYGVTLTFDELKHGVTIQNLFDTIVHAFSVTHFKIDRLHPHAVG